mgnify:FL=1
MSKNIITISREFGSGGRTIGKEVAKRLGYEYYDKDLVKMVALETGLDEGFIEQEGEYASGKNILSYIFSSSNRPVMNGMTMDDFLWVMQRKIVLDIAEKGHCVIVGRCADYILKDRSDCLNVFVHSSMENRAERIVRLYGESEKSPEKRLEEKDKKRSLYYKRHTGREWGMSQNYNLSIDSGMFGIDKCVDIILDLAEKDD